MLVKNIVYYSLSSSAPRRIRVVAPRVKILPSLIITLSLGPRISFMWNVPVILSLSLNVYITLMYILIFLACFFLH